MELRFVIYRHFVETGLAPSRHELADVVGDLGAVDRLLRELHDRHMVVLDDRDDSWGEIRMALRQLAPRDAATSRASERPACVNRPNLGGA